MFAIDLESKTCSCTKWKLSGIPYVHSVSAMACQGNDVENYASEVYLTKTYATISSYVVNPISGPAFWPRTGKDKLLPPRKLKLSGRPKKMRRRELDKVVRRPKLALKRIRRFGNSSNLPNIMTRVIMRGNVQARL